MTHYDLKLSSPFFDHVRERRKTFEIRRDDRGYAVNDLLTFCEFEPGIGYIGRECGPFRVTYILRHCDFPAGLSDGYVAMSIVPEGCP